MFTNKIVGILDAYYEADTDGIYWVVLDNNAIGYESVYVLQDGDYLFIGSDILPGLIDWEGDVSLKTDTDLLQSPTDPEYVHQAIDGYWVHGTQNGIDPMLWLKMFNDGRPAVVMKGEKNASVAI